MVRLGLTLPLRPFLELCLLPADILLFLLLRCSMLRLDPPPPTPDRPSDRKLWRGDVLPPLRMLLPHPPDFRPKVELDPMNVLVSGRRMVS